MRLVWRRIGPRSKEIQLKHARRWMSFRRIVDYSIHGPWAREFVGRK